MELAAKTFLFVFTLPSSVLYFLVCLYLTAIPNPIAILPQLSKQMYNVFQDCMIKQIYFTVAF